jgi:hypothetical protein
LCDFVVNVLRFKRWTSFPPPNLPFQRLVSIANPPELPWMMLGLEAANECGVRASQVTHVGSGPDTE